MAKATKTPAETYPTEGGSYLRTPDGKLDQVEQTKPVSPPALSEAEGPAGEPTEPPPAAPATAKE